MWQHVCRSRNKTSQHNSRNKASQHNSHNKTSQHNSRNKTAALTTQQPHQTAAAAKQQLPIQQPPTPHRVASPTAP